MSERPPLPYDFREVRQRLQGDLPRLLDRLQLRGQGDGERIYPLNPRRNDRKPGSFVIWLRGDRAGAWRDYAQGPDCKGDVIGLIHYVLAHRELIDSYWWALDFLGLGRGTVRTKEEAQRDRERLEADRAAAIAKQAADAEVKAAQCFKLWLSLPPIAGTIAETYLGEARGIPLHRLKELPGALRYAESVDWVDPATGEVIPWTHCMVSAMTRGSRVVALHRTWLQPDGSGKRLVGGKSKTMIGPVKDAMGRGAAIRLTKGAGGLSPGEAAKRGKFGPLAVGEGIETSLSLGVARPDVRTWAAGSLSLMGLVDWPACASTAVLLRDNDWDNPTAAAAFAAAEAHWHRQAAGRQVLTAAPPAEFNDFNDWARAAA